MQEFFKPWRRKLGVVTLVMACLFGAAWVRSLVAQDSIDLSRVTGRWNVTKKLAGLQNDRNQIVLLTIKLQSLDIFKDVGFKFRSPRGSPSNEQLLDFGIGVEQRVPFAAIPHWKIVLPLTLLSAWLLLLSGPGRSSSASPVGAPPAVQASRTSGSES